MTHFLFFSWAMAASMAFPLLVEIFMMSSGGANIASGYAGGNTLLVQAQHAWDGRNS